MIVRWGTLLIGTLAVAAVIGASAGARTSALEPATTTVSPSAQIAKILAAHGLTAKDVVVQHGVWNYAGPSCPGFGWTCTTATRVLQFAKNGSDNNHFQCTASEAPTPTGPDTCVILQVSTGGDNDAQCVEQSQVAVGESQSCQIVQSNTGGGDNHASVKQEIDANGGSAQDATQNATISQTTDLGGQNHAHIDQNINQQTNDAGTGGSQSQEGHQTASIGQTSDTGNNHGHIRQSLGQHEQFNPASAGPPGKNKQSGPPPVQTVDQTQNAADDGPNLNAAVYQTSNSGNDNGHIDQSIDQEANAVPAKNVTGSQTQGSPSGGINGHFDQETTGIAKAHGSQQEHQNLGGDKTNLVQTQYDPMWMGSPQGTNPDDTYRIDQQSQQNGSNSANQTDQIFSNCDTTGTCTAREDLNNNGGHKQSSCTGSDCHIGTTCSSGVGDRTGGCVPVTECDGDCGNPPPPPPNPGSVGNCIDNACDTGPR